jgi:valyl-tRNA synthetase
MSNSQIFSKPFDHFQSESEIRGFWDKNQFYVSNPRKNKKPYTILMPPPNVTGDLTMGHMMYTLQDILIRWHRAAGFEACLIPGTDHASIATEAKVTKMLAEKGISKQVIGREEFLKHAHEWKETYGGRIIESLKTLGMSCDWSRLTFTMGEKYSASVIKALVKLYKDGFVYKSYRLVNWCPVSQSVISDEEVNSEERNGHLWHIRYVLADDSSQALIVATTRPETLFGDLAVAVHPDDERYKHLIGKYVIVPVCNRKIPIIADTYVEQEFGTGALKITPAHDKNDFEIGKRHNLGLLNIMNPDASLNENVPFEYQNLDRFVARKILVDALTKENLLEKIEPHKLTVGISERGHVPIEYYLSEQWYIRMGHFANLALDATRSKRLKLVPEYQEKVWEHWLTNIQDWCISRQLWWGHRMPIYTCDKCQFVMCEEKKPKKCEQCGHKKLTQDDNVLDTWASSWMWPLGVHNWAKPNAKEKKSLEYYYPTDVIITGADIIFFWIARMVMISEYLTHKTPFHTCYFTPIIRDALGRKMSKSLGNSANVIEIMQTYGTDALRFSLVSQVVQGQDIHWKNESCELGKTFANKLWNVSRFLTMYAENFHITAHLCRFDTLQKRRSKSKDPICKWLISEFFSTVQRAHHAIENYEFAKYTNALYEFTWKIFCDWFVELIKPRLTENADKVLAQKTLECAFEVFDGLLRILHPVMPFITEKIWQTIFSQKGERHKTQTLGHQKLPVSRTILVDESSMFAMAHIQQIVSAVRMIRGKFNIHPAQELIVYTSEHGKKFENFRQSLETLTKAKFYFKSVKQGFCAASVIDGIQIHVSLEGLVDQEAEKIRLAKKIEKLVPIIAGLKTKLSNTQFVNGAPAHILAGAQKQLSDNETELKQLQDALAELQLQ